MKQENYHVNSTTVCRPAHEARAGNSTGFFTAPPLNPDAAECHLPHHGTGSSICDPAWDRAESPARQPGEGYGNIWTGPFYGCIHHEDHK